MMVSMPAPQCVWPWAGTSLLAWPQEGVGRGHDDAFAGRQAAADQSHGAVVAAEDHVALLEGLAVELHEDLRPAVLVDDRLAGHDHGPLLAAGVHQQLERHADAQPFAVS